MNVKVRFAPSPTGYLHIGGARTAIFNYLYAKHFNGKFYLRIEDTDIQRSTKEFEDEILNSMRWLGMEYDGEAIYQSKRSDIYKDYIKKLVDSGAAYYCDCTIDDLDNERQKAKDEKRKHLYNRNCLNKNLKSGVVRFKVPHEEITIINDVVLGDISISNEEIEDFIIARSDGSPTYNLTVVVDDHEMEITHVIRGDDHVNNTPKQLLLFKALGLEPPLYAHAPMILGPDKSKLSKRHGATSVSQFRKLGYLPEALLNYLVRLGWSHGDDEIMSKDQLIEYFDIKSIGKSASVINMDKLDWLNAHYLKNLEIKKLTEIIVNDNFVDNDKKDLMFEDHIQKLIPLVQERAKKLPDIVTGLHFILNDNIDYDEQAIQKHLTNEIKPVVIDVINKIEALDDISKEQIHSIIEKAVVGWNIKLKNLAQALRVLLTGKDVSPSIFDIMAYMPKNLLLRRLKKIEDTQIQS